MQQQSEEMVHQQQLVECLVKMVSELFTITTVISLMMCCTVPSGPPRQFSGVAESSTSIIYSWSAPATPNGVITEYQLLCSGGGQELSRSVMGSQTTTTLSDSYHTPATPVASQLETAATTITVTYN